MKIKSIIILAASSLVLASCLKSKGIIGLQDDSGSVVTEIWDVNYYGGEKPLSLNATPATETVTLVTLRSYYPRSNKPKGNVHVTLTLDPGAVTNAGLTPFPSNGYSLPGLEFDIPAGATEGSFDVPITINKNNLNLANTYGIAFHISAVSNGVISELAKSIVVAILIKNAYDADYHATGFFFHPSAPRSLDAVKHISTLGAARIQGQLGDLGGYNFAADVVGTSVTNWSGAPVTSMPTPPSSGLFTADRPGNGPYPGPEQPGTAPYLHSSYNNTYDAATKTFWMHYGYGVGSSSETGWSRQVYEKWVRQ
jgi:hypothetical protein